MSTQSKEQQQIGYLSLCYHYIRPDNDDPFPRLMGTKITEFKNQIWSLYLTDQKASFLRSEIK